jgi:hypothetical protein
VLAAAAAKMKRLVKDNTRMACSAAANLLAKGMWSTWLFQTTTIWRAAH